MKGSLFGALLVVVAAVGGFVYTVEAGNEPLLGLDLQGGVSVVLQPSEDSEDPSDEALDQALEIIRNRVDGLGVAEPEISRQGDAIVVELPGVDQQQRALELVGQTAELRFRPVLLDTSTMLSLGFVSPDDLGLEVEDTDTATDDTTSDDTSTDETDSDVGGVSTFDPETGEITEVDGDGADEQGMAPLRRRQTTSTTETPPGTDDDVITADEADTGTETDTGETDTEADADAEAETDADADAASAETDALLAELTEQCGGGLTAPEDNHPESAVVLADADGLPLCLGPTVVYGTDADGEPKYLTGAALEGADVGFDGFSWRVNPTFKAGEDGIDAFNYAATLCFGGSEACPFGRLAIALDEVVVSAPTIQTSNFQRDQIEISGNFDEESANDLALALRYGALPVDLVAQDVRTVSATVGDDVLRSGVIAGLIGLGLVALYLLAFYRLAGLVAVAGLLLSGLMLWSIIGWLGATQGLAISLAGIVGLIVSIGVSADSNIVYFENVKEQSAAGKRVSTAVERAYQSAISTIVKADVVSLIAAGLLYYLTVGAVKGFALYLGVATILDLVVSLLFMRPALAWLAARGAVQADPRRLGMPGGAK